MEIEDSGGQPEPNVMSCQQLRLFQPPQPLLARLGREFFRSLPARPGVYLMLGRNRRILYVGQSKNLRARLSSYLHVRPERDSRKTIRLVHEVEAIEWEECPSPEAARLRENQLLRAHRPRYNSANTHPQTYWFVCLQAAQHRWKLLLGQSPSLAGQTYGAFKGNPATAYTALLRLLWSAAAQPVSLDQFPGRLLGRRPPKEWELTWRAGQTGLDFTWSTALLQGYLEGSSPELIGILQQHLRPEEAPSLFHRNLLANDLRLVEEFFLRGPQRNFRLRQRFAWPKSFIPQEALDDLLVARDR